MNTPTARTSLTLEYRCNGDIAGKVVVVHVSIYLRLLFRSVNAVSNRTEPTNRKRPAASSPSPSPWKSRGDLGAIGVADAGDDLGMSPAPINRPQASRNYTSISGMMFVAYSLGGESGAGRLPMCRRRHQNSDSLREGVSLNVHVKIKEPCVISWHLSLLFGCYWCSGV